MNIELVQVVLADESLLELHDLFEYDLYLCFALFTLGLDDVVIAEELNDRFVDQVQRLDGVDLKNFVGEYAIVLEGH